VLKNAEGMWFRRLSRLLVSMPARHSIGVHPQQASWLNDREMLCGHAGTQELAEA